MPGQVPVSGQHQSCCAVVENCQRCVFFVPGPGVFGGAELASLEAAAAADPAHKLPLIRHLHVSCAKSSMTTSPCRP